MTSDASRFAEHEAKNGKRRSREGEEEEEEKAFCNVMRHQSNTR